MLCYWVRMVCVVIYGTGLAGRGGAKVWVLCTDTQADGHDLLMLDLARSREVGRRTGMMRHGCDYWMIGFWLVWCRLKRKEDDNAVVHLMTDG